MVLQRYASVLNMAKLSSTAREFIQKSFSPCVAVLSSPLVDELCQKNNLSFIELLEPFSTLDKEGNASWIIISCSVEISNYFFFLRPAVSFRDPSGSTIVVRNLRVVLSDVNQKPLEPAVARRLLNESVICDFDDVETTTVRSGEFCKLLSWFSTTCIWNSVLRSYRKFICWNTNYGSLVREMEGYIFQSAIPIGSRIYEALRRMYDICFLKNL